MIGQDFTGMTDKEQRFYQEEVEKFARTHAMLLAEREKLIEAQRASKTDFDRTIRAAVMAGCGIGFILGFIFVMWVLK